MENNVIQVNIDIDEHRSAVFNVLRVAKKRELTFTEAMFEMLDDFEFEDKDNNNKHKHKDKEDD